MLTGFLTLAVALAAPPADAVRLPCALEGAAEAMLALDDAGRIWLLDGERVLAEVDTDSELWPDNTLVRCEGRAASVVSQGEGTLVMTSLTLDFDLFLPRVPPPIPPLEPLLPALPLLQRWGLALY